MEALEELIINKFPLKSTQPDSHSFSQKDFLNLFEKYFSVFSGNCSITMLTPILSTYREGSSHKYYELIQLFHMEFVEQMFYDDLGINLKEVSYI